jgi:hypothetical protein
MRDFCLVLSALALLLPGRAVQAQERRVRVRYDVAVGCPDVAEFSGKLTQRTGALRLEVAQVATPDLDVTVRQDSGVFRGEVDVATREGRQRRAIDSDNCADLVSALALSAALMLEGAGSGASSSPPARPAESPQGATKPSAGRDDRAPAADARAMDGWRWSAGARFEATLVLTSGWALGPGAFVGLRRERGGIFSPSVRLGASYAVADIEAERGSARLQWVLGRADGCPLRLGSDALAVEPCAGLGLGALHGEGTVEQPQSDLSGWAELDVAMRAQALLWQRLLLEVEGKTVVPLSRYRFLFRDPDQEIRRIRSVGAAVALGAGASF